MTAARILLVGAGACPRLSLPQASDPEKDIAAVAVLLEHLAFSDSAIEHRQVVAQSSAHMIELLSWLYEPRTDIGMRMLYFSGHAVVMPGSQETALALPDSSFENPSSLISASLLHQYIANCALSEHVWIVDCCFAHGLSFKRLPEVVQGMLHHLVIASSSSRTATVGSAGVSPFTEALAMGIQGLAYAPDDAVLNVSRLMEFLAAEAERRHLPEPYFHYSGAAERIKFYAVQPQEINGNVDLLFHLRRRDPRRRELIVGLGETSDRTRDFAVAAGSDVGSGVWSLDGRSMTMLGMSKTGMGFSRQERIPIALEDVRDDAVWEESISLMSSDRLVVATVTSEAAVPDIDSADVRVLSAPPPTEGEVEDLLIGLPASANPDELSIQELVASADGSMLNLQRVLKGSAFLAEHARQAPARHVSIGQTVAVLGSESPGAARVLAVLAAAPGIRLPLALLGRWLMVAGGEESPQRTLDRLVSSGLVVRSGHWIMVPSAFARDIESCLPDGGTAFVDFVEAAMAPGPGLGANAMERFQILRAATLYCEQRVDSAESERQVARLFAGIGMELFATVRRELWMPLVEAVEMRLADGSSSSLLTVIGNGYRLADSYRRAEASLHRAIDLARAPNDHIRARAGLIRLAVQAGGTVALPYGDSQLVENAGGGESVDQAAADLSNQEGNRAFRIGDVDGARRCYRDAKERLHVCDIGSAMLAVDIEKGLGDVALYLDDRRAAEDHVTAASRLIADYGMMRLGRVPVAKLLQCAGDVARRRTVPKSDLVDGFNSRSAATARYWYERARLEYVNQELDLGALITTFKIAQLDALAGDRAAAFDTFTELIGMFARLENGLWAYRSVVAALISHGASAAETGDLLVSAYREEVSQSLPAGGLPATDHLWGKISLLPAADHQSWNETADMARRLGLPAIADALSEQRPGNWMFAYY